MPPGEDQLAPVRQPPEEQYSTVINYIKEHGTAQRRELTELLNIVPTQATYILRNMVSDGKLILDGKRYRLPPAGT